MNLKHLPNVLFQLELANAKLKIAELSAKMAEAEIYDGVCQNLVLVHVKLASSSMLNQPHLDVSEMSSSILQSVRDLRRLSRKVWPDLTIENEIEFIDLLKGANQVLKFGLSKITVSGDNKGITNTTFLYAFSCLLSLLQMLFRQNRKLKSLSVCVLPEGINSVIHYSGLPIEIGRLISANSLLSLNYKHRFNGRFKNGTGKLNTWRAIGGTQSVELLIPVFE